MAFEGPYRVEWTDSNDTVQSRVILPFKPSKMELYNNDTGAKALWTCTDDGTEDGGIMVIGADTVTELTTTTGLDLVTDPIAVYYNNPVTPTYVDSDGNAVTADSVIDIDGESWTDRYLPASVAGDTNMAIIGTHVKLPTNANNSNLRDDDNILVLLAWP